MDMSIIFATYHSENILRKSLESYCQIKTDYQWELIIVDNANRAETKEIIQQFKDRLPITFIEQSPPGKNNALNKALLLVQSELIWFTDNDILPNQDLINTYVDIANKNKKIDVFGGNILPDIKFPEWIDTSLQKIKAAYGILDLGLENKNIAAEDLWGGNMLIRKALFQNGIKFGTKDCIKGNNHIMGNETELLKRLDQAGHKTMYVADNCVLHQIRYEQISLLWLVKRAYNAGGGAAYNNTTFGIKTVLGIPRYLFKVLFVDIFNVFAKSLTFNKSNICMALMDISMTVGRIIQYFQDHRK